MVVLRGVHNAKSLEQIVEKKLHILCVGYALSWVDNAVIGVDDRLLYILYDRISSVSSIPPMKGIDTSI